MKGGTVLMKLPYIKNMKLKKRVSIQSNMKLWLISQKLKLWLHQNIIYFHDPRRKRQMKSKDDDDFEDDLRFH